MAAAVDDSSYRHLLAEYRARDNFDSVFRSTLDDLSRKLDLAWVRSCVAFGTGSGEHEMEFARRLLPNLTQLIAVEPDHESVKALRAHFDNDHLPGVETSIAETCVETWSGLEKPVDVALFFNAIYHVPTEPRRKLLQLLNTTYLSPNGIIVMIENASPVTAGYIRLMHSLRTTGIGTLRRTCWRAGSVSTAHTTEGVVKYIQLLFDISSVSEQTVRTNIAEIYNDPNPEVKQILRKLVIFRRNSQQK